jgi:hypothetical protein
MKEIVVVSGLPRSGTSMMMKMLESAGLEILTDNLRQADESNPKGYYEFERVKSMKSGDFEWLSQAQGKVVKVISALLEFLPQHYQYKVIFMHREMKEILASQKKMLERDGKPDQNSSDQILAHLYDDHLKTIEDWLDAQPHMEILHISYNEILKEPGRNIDRIYKLLGVKMDLVKMQKVVDLGLYRERQPD